MRAKLEIAVAAVLLAASQAAAATSPPPKDQWPSYGQNPGSTNFSPLTQITPRNVGQLQRAWTYRFGAGEIAARDVGIDYRWEVQPLIIDGVMYFSTPSNPRVAGLKATVTALVPETGEVLWKYESPRNIHGRGLAYWAGDGRHGPRLYFGTDEGYFVALDMKTGKLAADFGVNGEIDGYVGVVSPRVGESRRTAFTISNPATVYKNLVITGARPGEQPPPGPRGDIRAWDAVTGKLVWTFHTVPQRGEPNFETYRNPDETLDRSGANVWSSMTLDAGRGILFAPLGDLNGRAEGTELYSATLVALDAATGKLKWHQQITHKDLWDWDLPVPPVLAEVKRDGRTIPAVVQAGKHGLVFMFERETGRPIYEVQERQTPRSDDPNEIAWPTQPFPVKPEPVARVSMKREEIPDVVPGQKDYCTKFWDDNKVVNFGLYTRPMLNNGTVTFPTATGGPNWGPPSYNAATGLFVVSTQNIGSYRPAGPAGRGFGFGGGGNNRAAGGAAAPQAAPAPAVAASPAAPAQAAAPQPAAGGPPQQGFQFTLPGGAGVVPCAPTPWGELVAVNVNTGDIAWRVPLGDWEALGERGVGLGTRNLGGNITTASGLIFIGATNDRRFRAFDAKDGKLLWEVELEASAHSTPVTYLGRDGKQYVVTTAAGGTSAGALKMSDALVAFRLP
jgi:quinoprotein glucose dehydrogenase